jgi:hypothetical protein
MEKWEIPEPCRDCHYWVKTKCVAYGCKFKHEEQGHHKKKDKKPEKPATKEYLDYFDHV